MEAAVGRVLDSKFLVPAAPTFCEGRDRFGEPEGVSPRTSPCCEMSGANAARLAWNVSFVIGRVGRCLLLNPEGSQPLAGG